MGLVRKRFVLAERVRFTSAGVGYPRRRFPRVFPVRIRVFRLGNLLINIAGFVFVIERFKAARFKIVGRQGNCRFFGLGGRTMEQGQRLAVIFLGKGHFCQRVSGRSGKIGFAIIVQHSLEICPRDGALALVPVTFA